LTYDPSPARTRSLYVEAETLIARANFPTPREFYSKLFDDYYDDCDKTFGSIPHQNIVGGLMNAAVKLYTDENLISVPPPLPDATNDTMEDARYRDQLLRLIKKLSHPARTLDLIRRTIAETLNYFTLALPPAALVSFEYLRAHDWEFPTDARFTVPLIDLVNVPRAIIAFTVNFLEREADQALLDLQLFADLRERLERNQRKLSGVPYLSKSGTTKQLIYPQDFKGTSQQAVDAFLHGTPFHALFTLSVPFAIPNDPFRFEHTHILGPTGSGKTTLIQQIILDDLAKPDPPAMVIIDPKGLLIDRLSHLDVFNRENGRLKDRLIIVDPSHDPPPALNMFDAPKNAAFSDTQRARVINHLIETFSYIFSSTESRLTQRQSIPFSYVVRLIFSMSGDINTLMDVLEDNPKAPAFAAQIQQLAAANDGARRFFQNDFYSSAFSETRQQIKTRLHEIIAKPELMAMFAAPQCKLDIFDCIQNRKIVLVNTAMSQLGTKGSQLLGRYIISMTLNAAFSRFAVPKTQWNPAYLIIDEFQDFADEDKTPELMRLAREYNLGVVLAHQGMHVKELNESLRTSISTNTTIKYCASPEGVDISYMARDLRCDPSLLRDQTKTSTHARFACFVRGFLDKHPVSITLPFGNISREPQMSDAAHHRLLIQNRERVSVTPQAPKPPPKPAPILNPGAPPVADTHPEAGTPPEAGKDW